jgi:ferredoxin-NADP reductase
VEEYVVRLVDKKAIAKDTSSFEFEKPDGFKYKPGQFVLVKLIDPPKTDKRGNSRSFSIASAPHEKFSIVATREGVSAFKKQLFYLVNGSKIKISQPMGRFVLHEDPSVPAIFLVGGIGITPVRSIVFDAMHRQLAHQIYLFHSNRSPDEAPFLKKIQNLSNPNFKFIPTMTKVDDNNQPWNGEQGYIDIPMLKRYQCFDRSALYYIVGSKQFTSAMVEMIKKAGIEDKNIKQEMFAGY